MTRLAGGNRMETDKWKFCKVVIKEELLSPPLNVVALIAFSPLLPLMQIVQLVTIVTL